MITILFVHGTGVRKAAYDESFTQISDALAMERGLVVKECYWGHLGSDLHAGGASIPEYDQTRALDATDSLPASEDDYIVALWNVLYEDPVYELRVLAARPETGKAWVPGQVAAASELAVAGSQFEPSTALRDLLKRGAIDNVFEQARKAVTSSSSYRLALERAPEALDEYRSAIARAFIAMSVALVEGECGRSPIIARDAQMRDHVEQEIFTALAGGEYALGAGWVKQALGGMVLRVATFKGVRNRGALSDAASPAAGDILLYQARGEAIRDCIRKRIADIGDRCVVLAHSLGGIATVDLLISERIDLRLLITVGSQAPYLYEINALQSLPFGQPLPAHFPKWLNIYDLRDFLSYKASKIFPGRVEDVAVDNREPFHWSHSAYWSNDEVWTAIKERLR